MTIVTLILFALMALIARGLGFVGDLTFAPTVEATAGAKAAGGGGAASIIDDDLTTDDNYTASGSYTVSADSTGTKFTRNGGSGNGVIVHATEHGDLDVIEMTVTLVDGSSLTRDFQLHLWGSGQSGGSMQNSWAITCSGGNMVITERSSGANVNHDTTAISLSPGDEIKIRVAKNGSNWDVTGYVNGVAKASVTNEGHGAAGSLGRKVALQVGYMSYQQYMKFKDMLVVEGS